MVATFESVLVLRLSDVQELTKTYLDAWKSGKVCCPHKDCYSKNVLLCSDGLNHHYRIQHSRDSPCGDQEIKQAKALLRKLLAAETLNNLLILSQKRREQVSLVSLIFTFKFCSVKLNCSAN